LSGARRLRQRQARLAVAPPIEYGDMTDPRDQFGFGAAGEISQ
jgi:hypothetical protein